MISEIVAFLVALDTVLIAIIGAVVTIYIAISEKRQKIRDKRREKRQQEVDERAELRRKESILAIKLMDANVALSVATAMAVKDGNTNGTMSNALKKAEKAADEYDCFVTENAADNIHSQ
jgi:uncharacterized membrane protein